MNHYATIDGFFFGTQHVFGDTRDDAMCEAITIADENAWRWSYADANRHMPRRWPLTDSDCTSLDW